MTGVVRLYDALKPFADLYHRWRRSPFNEAWQDAEDCFYPGGELPTSAGDAE